MAGDGKNAVIAVLPRIVNQREEQSQGNGESTPQQRMGSFLAYVSRSDAPGTEGETVLPLAVVPGV
ncbi:hypothetical protein sch_02570 [Serratia plymuthica]|nr:hypothetical protein sch_02570 [Serratia plymuthica]